MKEKISGEIPLNNKIEQWIKEHVTKPFDGYDVIENQNILDLTRKQYGIWAKDMHNAGDSIDDIISFFESLKGEQ